MTVLHDHALLLRRTPYGESSLVAHLLTRHNGRVHVLAKGAYRPSSRAFCVLDLFDTLELEWSTSPRRELDLVLRGDRLRRRRAIPCRPAAYRAALAMLELAELAAQPNQPEPRLFALLEAQLDALDDSPAEEGGSELSLARFECGLLDLLGLAPALTDCAACGRSAPPLGPGGPEKRTPGPAVLERGERRVAFSAGAGGRLCAACAAEARGHGRRVGTLPLHVVEAAAMLARGERVLALAQDPGLRERVRDLFERFLAYHVERHPRLLRQSLAVRPVERSAAGRVERAPIRP